MWALRVWHRGAGLVALQGYLRSKDSVHGVRGRCLGKSHRPIKTVVVGNCHCGKPQLGTTCDHFFRGGDPIKKTETTVQMKLGVGHYVLWGLHHRG